MSIQILLPIAILLCCIGMLLHLRTGHSKKILNLVLIHQVPMYKIVFAFRSRLRLTPAQELCDNDEPIIIIYE